VYGKPAIVFWQRTSSGFKWLAYKTLQDGDGVVYNSGGYPRLRTGHYNGSGFGRISLVSLVEAVEPASK